MIDPNNPDYSNTPASPLRQYDDFRPADPKAPPKVSILTPFYNTGEVFHETAKCIQRQTFQQWEWIIVNDCSTDPEALKVLDQYRQSEDPRIRVVDLKENSGPSRTRNLGVNETKTEYIYHIDSDDLIEPTTIEKCYWYLISHPECPFVNGWSVGFGSEEYLWHFGYHNGEKFRDENLVTGRTMIRKSIHLKLGGYDEVIRRGCEDWAFWIKAAEQGIWGTTIPEYFDWYRRREQHWSRWETLNAETRMKEFRNELAQMFPNAYWKDFPEYRARWQQPFDEFADELPATNQLEKVKPRLVFIIPWMAMGGADKFNLDVVEQLTAKGWDVTLVTTRRHPNPWLNEFQKITPDIFILPNFVYPSEQPLFLRYLIQSRQADAVLISSSELAYWCLPYLKHHFPATPFFDYCHIEEENWKNGGYPRYAARNQDHLSLNLVSSHHLARWMTDRGADAKKIEVIHTNIDTEQWKPDPAIRKRIREQEGIAEETPVILFAGRICAQKQPEVLANTLLKLHKSNPDFIAWIAGDGENRPWLEDFLQKTHLTEKVKTTGAISLENIRERMKASDIFFLPSLWEGIALSVYEAMASELVLVGADVGGQKELVTPETGILIQRSIPANWQQEVSDYHAALQQLLENPAKRRQMASAARQRICENFQLEMMSGKLDPLLRNPAQRELAKSTCPYSHAIACESAIKAVEYFRVEALAEYLWLETRNPKQSNDSASISFARDPLREWNHIHKYLPFKLYRWAKTGWRGKLLKKTAKNSNTSIYDENLPIEKRLQNLATSRFFQSMMRLRKKPGMRALLPKNPGI
jgi:glycosyltransferase involved in cell wall biosynthesis